MRIIKYSSFLRYKLFASTLLVIVAQCPSVFAADKVQNLLGSIGGDITMQQGEIIWIHAGTKEPSCNQKANGSSDSLVIGNGIKNFIQRNALCTQTQISTADLIAVFDPDNNQTSWKSLLNDDVLGDFEIPAFIVSNATVDNPAGSSSTSTSFITTGNVNFTTSVNLTDATKDDAFVGGSNILFSEATGRIAFLLNNSPLLEVNTRLFAENGASGSLTDSGLTLLAAPNQNQLTGYSAEAINSFDSSQNLSFSITFDGNNLFSTGINSSLFQFIEGGLFLPFEDLPGENLTATVTSGTLAYESSAFAQEIKPEPVPEPTSTLSLLALGTLGAGSTLLRKKKHKSLINQG